jgi:hypothetical protein
LVEVLSNYTLSRRAQLQLLLQWQSTGVATPILQLLRPRAKLLQQVGQELAIGLLRSRRKGL